MSDWSGSYAVWSAALGLPPDHGRVADAVVREKLSLAVQRLHDTAGRGTLYPE